MTTNKPTFFEKANNWLKNSITIKIITIAILILLLLIPVSMVQSLIRERSYRQDNAIREVSSKWGEEQTIKGLVLTIPYKIYEKVYFGEKQSEYKVVETIEYAHFLPESLNINGVISPEIRYRGIYEVIVYNSTIKIEGHFKAPDFEELEINEKDILWKSAFISLGLSDLRSIQNSVSLRWNQQEFGFNPGLATNDVIDNGISVQIPIEGNNSIESKNEFSLDINFNGSSGLNFIPLGKLTHVQINSDWNSPSFIGAFLPDNRVINNDGFKADWEVLYLNRPYPQSFTGSMNNIDQTSFGVNLIVPVDEYQKSTRSAKYAALLITLTFLIFFFIQILNRVRIHPIQYIIVGLALCVFYTLLIALSEHIAFDFSYLISSISIVGLITFYAKNIFKIKKLTAIIGLILSFLYLFIYFIIQMEDYALLMGSIGLFVVLAVIMFLSRKIDWYAIKTYEE